jgi:hypothetical protein
VAAEQRSGPEDFGVFGFPVRATGVSITQVLGISLSAQTGYDTDTTVAFHVDHGNHWLCGTNTFPGSYPERAQWGKKKR